MRQRASMPSCTELRESRSGRPIARTHAAMLVFALAVLSAPLSGQPPTTPSSSGSNTPRPDPVSKAAAPVTILQWGIEQRTRWENWNNIIDFSEGRDDRRNQIRFRNRFWLSVPIHSSVDLFVGVTNEFKKQSTPDLPLNGNELIFESLYLDFQKVLVPKLSVRVGRQDLFRGEGFLLADGTSGDGSRTAYFNAIDVAYTVRQSKLELIGILDPKQDRFLPRLNDQRTYLTEWDEQALVVYYTDKNLKSTDLEGYYFYKKELNDYRAITNPQFQPNRTVNTIGGRLVHRFSESLSATGEFAGQWGRQHPNTDVRAWGGYATFKKTFAGRLRPYFVASYWAMSGDNPQTPNVIEGWDPLFSRWPKWGGDLSLYSLIPENGVGYASNDRFSQLEAGLSPLKHINVRGTWYHHDAFHPMKSGTGVFGGGNYRGELMQIRSDIVLGPSVKGHVLYERFLPGDFYREQPPGHFFRMEITYSFKSTLPRQKD